MDNTLLELISEQIQEERRRRNAQLQEFVEGKSEVYNAEDLMRLVGELNAAYNHCVASLAGDGDIYCLLKHLSTSVILSGEVDGDATAIYQMLSALTDGKIEPCSACKEDKNKGKKKEK